MTALAVDATSRPVGSSPGRPLRIGLIAPTWFTVRSRSRPPPTAGAERWLRAWRIARSPEVTTWTPVGAGPSATAAQRYCRVYPSPPSARLGDPVPEVLHAAAAAATLDSEALDVVHDHTLAGPLLARGRAVPTVVTAHGPVAGELGDYLARLGATVDVVAISDAQRRLWPELNWASTVHNGVDVASFPLGDGGGGYLLFLGRFNPDKGAHLAIDAAEEAGCRLVLAGKLNERAEKAYFASAIALRLGPGVEYIGEADAATKRELYAGALALVFPVCW